MDEIWVLEYLDWSTCQEDDGFEISYNNSRLGRNVMRIPDLQGIKKEYYDNLKSAFFSFEELVPTTTN